MQVWEPFFTPVDQKGHKNNLFS